MRLGWVLALSAAALFGAPAYAQQNTLVIEQSNFGGAGNRLTVDQSDASGSRVLGLSIDRDALFLDAPDESLQALDESETAPLSGEDAARQIGTNNVATINVEGFGGEVRLLQDSDGISAGNTAIINALDGSNAIVGQVGGGNFATVDLENSLSEGTIVQIGNNNNGSVTASDGSTGVLIQLGNNNDQALRVTGGTNVTLTQNTSNQIATVPAQVFSNGATVQITQTQFQGLN